MDINREYSKEEIEELIKKQKKDLQEALDKMTPEEREEAMLKAQKIIKEDEARINSLIENAKKYTSGAETEEKPKPKFCGGCGAPAGNGKFCAYCGRPLS